MLVLHTKVGTTVTRKVLRCHTANFLHLLLLPSQVEFKYPHMLFFYTVADPVRVFDKSSPPSPTKRW